MVECRIDRHKSMNAEGPAQAKLLNPMCHSWEGTWSLVAGAADKASLYQCKTLSRVVTISRVLKTRFLENGDQI